MKPLKKLIFLIFAFLISVLSCFTQSKDQYIIASGSRGGNYIKVGSFIANQYNANIDANFTSIETDGSLDNLELLKNNFADFAIVQRNVLLNSLYDETNGINNIEVIAPLFEEKLLIYSHVKIPVNINSLKDSLINNKITIGFTSKTGYTYKLFQFVTKYLSLNTSNLEEKFASYKDLISEFKDGKLDYIVSFSLPIKEIENLNNVDLVYFNKQDVNLIENRIPNLFGTNLNTNNEQYTLGSWTFLIGDKNKVQQLKNANKLVFTLCDTANKSDINNMIIRSISLFENNKDWKNKYLEGIPMHTALIEEIGYVQNNTFRNVVIFFFLLLLFLLVRFLTTKKVLPKINYLYLWIRFKHIFLGLLILCGLYFLSIQSLIISESVFYKNIGIKSQLLNLSNKDLHFWLLIRNLTGNDSGIFPLSTVGKLMLSFSSYLIWIGTVLIAISEYIAHQISKKRKQGLMRVKYKNHIVIIGWNDTTSNFIST